MVFRLCRAILLSEIRGSNIMTVSTTDSDRLVLRVEYSPETAPSVSIPTNFFNGKALDDFEVLVGRPSSVSFSSEEVGISVTDTEVVFTRVNIPHGSVVMFIAKGRNTTGYDPDLNNNETILERTLDDFARRIQKMELDIDLTLKVARPLENTGNLPSGFPRRGSKILKSAPDKVLGTNDMGEFVLKDGGTRGVDTTQLSADVTQLQTDVDAIETDVGGLQTDVAALQSSSTSSDVASLQTETARLESDKLNKNFDNLPDPASVTIPTASVERLKTLFAITDGGDPQDLSQLIDDVAEVNTINDSDKLILDAVVTETRPELSNPVSFSTPNQGAVTVAARDFVASVFRSTAPGNAQSRVWMLSTEDVSNAYTGRLFMPEPGAASDLGGGDRKAMVMTDGGGKKLFGALLVNQQEGIVVLLTNHDELTLEFTLREGVTEATYSSTYTANLGFVKRNGAYEAVGGYVFTIPATRYASIFPGRATNTIAGFKLFITSLSEVSGGVQVEHLHLEIADLTYISVVVGETAKKVPSAAIFDRTEAQAKAIVHDTENRLQDEIDELRAGGGGGDVDTSNLVEVVDELPDEIQDQIVAQRGVGLLEGVPTIEGNFELAATSPTIQRDEILSFVVRGGRIWVSLTAPIPANTAGSISGYAVSNGVIDWTDVVQASTPAMPVPYSFGTLKIVKGDDIWIALSNGEVVDPTWGFYHLRWTGSGFDRDASKDFITTDLISLIPLKPGTAVVTGQEAFIPGVVRGSSPLLYRVGFNSDGNIESFRQFQRSSLGVSSSTVYWATFEAPKGELYTLNGTGNAISAYKTVRDSRGNFPDAMPVSEGAINRGLIVGTTSIQRRNRFALDEDGRVYATYTESYVSSARMFNIGYRSFVIPHQTGTEFSPAIQTPSIADEAVTLPKLGADVLDAMEDLENDPEDLIEANIFPGHIEAGRQAAQGRYYMVIDFNEAPFPQATARVKVQGAPVRTGLAFNRDTTGTTQVQVFPFDINEATATNLSRHLVEGGRVEVDFELLDSDVSSTVIYTKRVVMPVTARGWRSFTDSTTAGALPDPSTPVNNFTAFLNPLTPGINIGANRYIEVRLKMDRPSTNNRIKLVEEEVIFVPMPAAATISSPLIQYTVIKQLDTATNRTDAIRTTITSATENGVRGFTLLVEAVTFSGRGVVSVVTTTNFLSAQWQPTYLK